MAKDSLSALIDGECTPAELGRILDEMEHSPELKDAWSRLCLARDAAEGVRVRKEQPCICAGVMSKLEPRPAEQAAHPTVVPLTKAPRMRTYWKPAAGLAAAASMAVIAVTLVAPRDAAGPAVSVPAFAQQVGTPVSVPAARPQRPGGLQVVSASGRDLQRAALEDELRQYLIEHSNTLADRGMGATLSYARVAAHSVGEPMLQSVSFDPAGDQP